MSEPMDVIVCGRLIGTAAERNEVGMSAYRLYDEFEPILELSHLFDRGHTLEVDYLEGTLQVEGGHEYDLIDALRDLPRVEDDPA